MVVQERGTFGGMAATLMALALLAERAAGHSLPVRFIVLAVLGRAERIARAFVARELAADWPDAPCLEEPADTHYGPADAVLLALRLRMLAVVLDALAGADDHADAGLADEQPGGAAHRSALLPLLRCEAFPLLLVFRLPAACGRAPPDTS